MRRHSKHQRLEIKVDVIGPQATPEQARAAMKKVLHDCPECRAAMARGEEPIIGTGDDLQAELARSRVFARRPRWRTMKRTVR